MLELGFPPVMLLWELGSLSALINFTLGAVILNTLILASREAEKEGKNVILQFYLLYTLDLISYKIPITKNQSWSMRTGFYGFCGPFVKISFSGKSDFSHFPTESSIFRHTLKNVKMIICTVLIDNSKIFVPLFISFQTVILFLMYTKIWVCRV